MFNTIKYLAPYIYCKDSSITNLWDLYVAVMIPNGFRLVVEGSVETNDQGFIVQIGLKKDAAAKGLVYTEHHHLAAPGVHAAHNTAVTVNVNVFDEETDKKGSISNKMQYRDRDLDPTLGTNADEIAYNCPYIFLEGPETSQNGTPAYAASLTHYQPYVLLFPNGYRLQRDEVQIGAPENGFFESYIFLVQDTSVVEGAEPITGFTTNQAHYFDTGGHEGNFLVTVILEGDVQLEDSLTQSTELARHRELKRIEEEILSAVQKPQGTGHGHTEGNNGTTENPPLDPKIEDQALVFRNLDPGRTVSLPTHTPSRKKAKTRNLNARSMTRLQEIIIE